MIRKFSYALVLALAFVGASIAGEKMQAHEATGSGLVARTGNAEKLRAVDAPSSTIKRQLAPRLKTHESRLSPLLGIHAGMQVHGHYIVTAYDARGVEKWRESFDNLVTTVGKNDMLDKYLAGTSWSTGTVYMGLKGTGSAAAGDTMASHAGWSELNISATSGARQSVAFSAASSGSKATSSAVAWSITSSGTVAGCFIVIGGTSTNGNTTGVLFSAGDFAASRSVINGDTLNVTYSSSL